ncbi:MAG: FkbM family methyltransferase [Ginsengibacter sp.]
MIRKIKLYNRLNSLIHKTGLDLRRFPTSDQRILLKYLKDNNVNTCFDVGANTGQYAKLLRSAGFKGEIFSFEPQLKAFNKLSKSASADSHWLPFNFALGDTDTKSTINISKNSVSSSILGINTLLIEAAPETEYINKQDIQIHRLDTFLEKFKPAKRLFLKIDAQGFESKILAGAEGCFSDIYALQLELSCVSLYKGEILFDEMKAFIESKDFYLSSLESGFTDLKTGRLLQVDAIFLREM